VSYSRNAAAPLPHSPIPIAFLPNRTRNALRHHPSASSRRPRHPAATVLDPSLPVALRFGQHGGAKAADGDGEALNHQRPRQPESRGRPRSAPEALLPDTGTVAFFLGPRKPVVFFFRKEGAYIKRKHTTSPTLQKRPWQIWKLQQAAPNSLPATRAKTQLQFQSSQETQFIVEAARIDA
jgi:hypothetical protein